MEIIIVAVVLAVVLLSIHQVAELKRALRARRIINRLVARGILQKIP